MENQQLISQIKKLKKEKGIKILAHTYQAPEVLEIADITGDSFALSEAAKNIKENTILMCGVRFMGETVKILSPEKRVILSHCEATCPMAEQLTKERILQYKKQHPDHVVVAYINTTAELKSVSDVCVTSSSAVKIVNALDAKDILFIPDKNLGSYVASQIKDKNFYFMDGCCPVHNKITAQDVLEEKQKHKNAKVVMHPECQDEAVKLADFVGSTAAIIDYINNTDEQIIIATERGVYDYIKYKNPKREIYQLRGDKLTCEDMKLTGLQEVYNAITGKGGCDIEIEESLLVAAKRSIDNMLFYGNKN